MTTDKYVNPFTDFGFKKLFGEEASKPALIDFLNGLIPEAKIVSLSFKDKEKLGRTAEDRRGIYDLYCEDAAGRRVIVEMQKAKQNYFRDRAVFYASFPIQEQAQQGYWDYNLKTVYCVGVLDFCFATRPKAKKGEGKKTKEKKAPALPEPPKEVIHTVQLKDQNNAVFYDKLKFVYLEMPNFTKEEKDLETRLDKWLYFLKHLSDFSTVPAMFGNDEVFAGALQNAAIANYSETEMARYMDSLKVARDLHGMFSTAYDDGIAAGNYAVIDKGAAMGLNAAQLAELTGLPEAEIEAYLKTRGD